MFFCFEIFVVGVGEVEVVFVVLCGLFGVVNVEFDVVKGLDGVKVFGYCMFLCVVECCCV